MAAKKTGDASSKSGAEQQPKGPTEITATQQGEFDMQSRIGVFVGNVKVVDPQFTMTADKLTVHLNRQEDGGGLDQAEADGNVFIVHMNAPQAPAGATPAAGQAAGGAQPAQPPVRSTGKGAHALYQAKDGSVTLTGWPEVTQGLNTQVALDPNVKMILFRDGRMKTFGNTKTVIENRAAPTQPQANAAH